MINFILYENPELGLVCLPPGTSTRYSLATAAYLTGVHPEVLRYYSEHCLAGSSRALATGEPVFDDNALYEVRRIELYRRETGVNRQALPLICELWREIDRLQGEIRTLQGR